MPKEILINMEPQEKRVALLEDQLLQEFYVERMNAAGGSLVGNIYKGRVASVVPGIEAAFIDLGLEKNGFLYVSDIVGPGLEYDEEGPPTSDVEERPAASRRPAPPARTQSIQDLLKKGQEILVQVVKEPWGTKGVRLTSHITLPGRTLVLMPTESHLGISKKVSDPAERERIKVILKELNVPQGMGVIIRTAGVGKGKREFVRDLQYLLGVWNRVRAMARKRQAPSLIHEEYDLTVRVIRDLLGDDVDKMTVDCKDEYRKLQRFVRILAPQLRDRVQLYQGAVPFFEARGVEAEVQRIYSPRVELKSGGYIIIEPLESLVAIDVNTGKFTGRKSLEETVSQVNIEAALEIARQMRLRDLGGIIIIDFIDMESHKNQRRVLETLEDALKRDRAKTNILQLSQLGLVEMTRQRIRRSIESLAFRDCPTCHGRGSVKSSLTLSIECQRQIKKAFGQDGKREVELTVHPEVASRLFNEDRILMARLEREHRGRIIVKPDPTLPFEEIRIQ